MRSKAAMAAGSTVSQQAWFTAPARIPAPRAHAGAVHPLHHCRDQISLWLQY
jgi:hypothetical protein